MGNMLPFSGVDFFILIFGFILILHLFKNILNKIISYNNHNFEFPHFKYSKIIF